MNNEELLKRVDIVLDSLSKSKFRNRFHLKEKDKDYVKEKTGKVIKEHAYQFIEERLAPKYIENDGKQTPTRHHPVFIAQHATATCCRECLYKWHKIPKNKELDKNEIDYIVRVIMTWIKREMTGE